MTRRAGVAAAAAALALAPAPPAPAAAPIEGLHHELTLRLDPAAATLEAVDTIRLTGGGEVSFRLGPQFAVDGLVVDGTETAVAPAAGRWRVALGAKGEHSLTVRYHATLAAAPEGGQADTALAFAGPEGSFLAAAAGWYPRFDDAAFTYRLAVEVPADQRALAPGRLLDEEEAGDTYRARFAVDVATDELIVIAGPYRISERRHGAIRVRTYFHPELAGLEDTYLTKTAAYLDAFAARIGPYPYSAFHVVSGPVPVGLGFPYLTYMGTAVLRLPFIPDTSLGHEVLHSWWGNGITVDYGGGNWAEALTTFMADYAFAEAKGAGEARAMRLRWLRDYAALAPARDRPLRGFTSRRHGAAQVIGYHKGAMLFVMLRDEIGARAFDQAIRLFWRDEKFRTAGWGDLRRAFERTSGRDLGRFFDQWLKRKGAPSLRLGGVASRARAGGFEVSFTLAQDRPAYALSVPVVISTTAGPVRRRLRLDDAKTRYVVASEAQPVAVAVDPDFEVFRLLAPGEAPPILREVMLAPEAAVVVAAGDAAAREAAQSLVAALLEGTARPLAAGAGVPAEVPLLVVGTTGEVAAALAAAGLPAVPDEVRGRGTARVWTARANGARFLAVVAGDDAAALARLARPLPHYGAKSFLVFDGRKAIAKGVWPAGKSPLSVSLR